MHRDIGRPPTLDWRFNGCKNQNGTAQLNPSDSVNCTYVPIPIAFVHAGLPVLVFIEAYARRENRSFNESEMTWDALNSVPREIDIEELCCNEFHKVRRQANIARAARARQNRLLLDAGELKEYPCWYISSGPGHDHPP
ncbi:hypothetical protein BDW67DRAFT_158538 [Aspergillus spinulosporus]